MIQVNRLGAFDSIAAAALLGIGMEAQADDPAALIQQMLITQTDLTKSTAGRSNTVTASDVVLLHDGVTMCGSASSYALSNDNRSRPKHGSRYRCFLTTGRDGEVGDKGNPLRQ